MRYGLVLPNGGPRGDARSLAELAYVAEETGWDGVFLEDYLIWQGRQDTPTYDSWIALAAMSLQTEKIRLGTMVTALPRRRPWKVAKETVTLDHLSSGRLILGVGLGDTSVFINDPSFTQFGEVTDIKRRAALLDETLDILVGLWSGEPFSYQGQFYRMGEVTLLPCPVQTPRIPIWVGGGWPLKGPSERAARWDGSCLYKYSPESGESDWTAADVRSLKAFVDARRTSQSPFDIALGGRPRSHDPERDRELIRSLAEAGATWWTEYIPPQAGGMKTARKHIEKGPLRID